MADTKVSGLSAATTLVGTEVVPCVQGGASVKATINQIGTATQLQTSAAKSDMTTATSLLVDVVPGIQNYHPGHPKAHGRFATAANVITESYGVSSITNTSTGLLAVTFTGAFSSSTTYDVQVQVEMTATTFAVANDRKAKIQNGTLASGTVSIVCIDSTATTMLVKDPSSWHFAAWGTLNA